MPKEFDPEDPMELVGVEVSGSDPEQVLDDIVHVIESGNEGGVSLWDLDQNLITRWRSNEPEAGSILGGHGICVDLQGSIYVTEIGQGQRVTKFQKL